jgi:hypothetical protein
VSRRDRNVEDESRRMGFDLLLTSYQAERQQDQSSWTVSVGLVAAGIALLGTSGFAIAHAGDGVPGWLVALLPIPPIPLFAIATLMGNTATLRTRYLERLEQELQAFAPNLQLPSPAGYRLAVSAWHDRRGAIGQALIYLPLAGLYAALVVESLRTAINLHATVLGCIITTLSVVASGLLLFVYADEWRSASRVAGFLSENRQRASEN